MSQKINIDSVVVAITSFLGGLAVGLLLTPRNRSNSRVWLSNQAVDLTRWVNRQRKFAPFNTNKIIRTFRNNMNQGVNRIFPDLYEATEHIALSDRDILGE